METGALGLPKGFVTRANSPSELMITPSLSPQPRSSWLGLPRETPGYNKV